MTGQQAQSVDHNNGAVDSFVYSTNTSQDHPGENTLFITSPAVFVSSPQLNAIANTANHFYQPEITITPNLNISVSGVLNHKNRNVKHNLLKKGLSVSDEDVANTVSLSNAEIKKNHKYDGVSVADGVFATTLLTGKLSQKILRGLAALIQLENLSGVHLLSPTEFLFEFNTSGRIDVLRYGLDELGFSIKA